MISRFTLDTLIICIIYIVGKTGCYRRRKRKRVLVPDLEPLDDYPGGPHDTTMLTRYNVDVARKASEGVKL